MTRQRLTGLSVVAYIVALFLPCLTAILPGLTGLDCLNIGVSALGDSHAWTYAILRLLTNVGIFWLWLAGLSSKKELHRWSWVVLVQALASLGLLVYLGFDLHYGVILWVAAAGLGCWALQFPRTAYIRVLKRGSSGTDGVAFRCL